MDPTPKYIKMCEKATELQDRWQPTAGDYILHRYTIFGEDVDKSLLPKGRREQIEILCYQPTDTKDFWIGTANDKLLILSVKDFIAKTHVWLPRQDQLWKMLPTLWPYILHYHGPQLGYCLCADRVKWSGRELESVLLQACFFLVYRKQWNGKEWVDAANI